LARREHLKPYERVSPENLRAMTDALTNLFDDADWRTEVAEYNTRLGYEEWLAHQIDNLLGDVEEDERRGRTEIVGNRAITELIRFADGKRAMETLRDDLFRAVRRGERLL
jgi:hypothetical protein